MTKIHALLCFQHVVIPARWPKTELSVWSAPCLQHCLQIHYCSLHHHPPLHHLMWILEEKVLHCQYRLTVACVTIDTGEYNTLMRLLWVTFHLQHILKLFYHKTKLVQGPYWLSVTRGYFRPVYTEKQAERQEEQEQIDKYSFPEWQHCPLLDSFHYCTREHDLEKLTEYWKNLFWVIYCKFSGLLYFLQVI